MPARPFRFVLAIYSFFCLCSLQLYSRAFVCLRLCLSVHPACPSRSLTAVSWSFLKRVTGLSSLNLNFEPNWLTFRC